MKTSIKALWALLLTLSLFAAACGSDTEAGEGDGGDTETTEAESESSEGEGEGEGEMSEGALPGDGKSITMARANWSSGYVQAQILRELLIELGYEVSSPDAKEFAPDTGYLAMAQGEVDFWANSWYPGHFSWLEGDLPTGGTVGDQLTIIEDGLFADSGVQGFLVTKAWADTAGVTDFAQVNADEALWKELDYDGNGKGNVYGCPEDWTCDDIIASTLAKNGWDNLEQTSAGYDAMWAEFLGRAEAGEAAIMYTWTPTAYIAAAIPGETVYWLSMANDEVLDDSNPLGREGGEEWTQGSGFTEFGPDVCTQGPDGCQLGWEAADILITANSAWLADNPAAEELFHIFRPSVVDISIATVEYENSAKTQADVEAIAQAWVANNRDLVDGWLSQAKAAAG